MTRIGYTTIQYIYSSSEWIVDECRALLSFLLSLLHPIHSSAYVLMSVNRLFFLSLESVLPRSALETHCGDGVACSLGLVRRHMLLSL